jgi:tetratricopeptide (TPR) repeat protein
MTTETEFQDYFSMVSRAQALMDIERWSDAVAILNKGLAANPDNHWILCSLSLSHLSLGDRDRAMEYANRAVSIAPEEEWGYRLRSVILLQQKKSGEALQAAQEAVRVAPEWPTALYVLVQALTENKRLDEAKAAAEKLRQIAPESEIAHEALGNVALEQRRWGEAEEHFEAALRINPQSYEAMNNLGVALLNQGRKDEATERFHQAAAINPMGEVARANLKAAVTKFLPLTGAALFFIFKAFALKAPLFVGWITLQSTRLFFRSDDSFSWTALFGGLLALALTILYLVMLFSGVYSLRSSRFKHLPERLQSYIHLERSRAWQGFVWRAVGGASLVVLVWWGLLWSGHSQGEYAPQTITGWLIFIALCATTVTSGVKLWRQRR